ncbi:hypothetical protein EUTSA_v10023398mg [Eutrema salsugineum]|uniref:BHLH domain-containing protein n=1 Tax=Eutrema salsugineum TaxID=72664 RepID=V4KGB9_EUTSA|nr:hypothetical protein EUTSA_v10023398mg [Eutrema salsugineum]
MDLDVKQILKSLCFSHGWSYAVFWGYDPINPMLLRFKEAHKYDEASAALADDMILQAHDHILGQGIVGEAALTGNYRWLFSDTLFQTIAIIPVGSSGVVQLGSTQKIVESPEMLEQTTRALLDCCLKQQDQSDSLFESLLPLGDCSEIMNVPESFQGLSFDVDFFTDDNPPSLLISDKTSEPPHLSNYGDDFGFDILSSYSLDDLYELLADSPQQNCSSGDHQETSMVIQGNNDDDKDLFDIFEMINSDDSPSVTSHQGTPLDLRPKGLFSEIISSSLSNSTCSSLINYAQESYSCLNHQSKRRKLESSSSSAHSSSFFPQMMSHAETVTPPPPLNLHDPQRSLWIDEDRSSVAGNWKKQPHEEGVKKKRAKAGESRRPRPKDRQMIQDRIKELRGMIPNGAKCSIDTLLDLTIRHMLFMQSIAKYADKLKQPYEPKLVKENERTWALEVGEDESVVCPIIVEDLKPQGQMQIEMVCEETGERFLEIADVVRNLGLNILKGVMETRQGQIWAHFIVEAKPHVTRLQLLCSLVHLFQQHSSSQPHQT